jgi:CRISPR-associated endonuclease Csn1
LGINSPSGNDIVKYLLAKECEMICPYTGRSISRNGLFGTNPEFEIEHIIPLSISLDDSFVNKTLCFCEENRGV